MVLFVVILLVVVRWIPLKSEVVRGKNVAVRLVVCVEISFVVCRSKKYRVTRYLWRKVAHVLSVCVMLIGRRRKAMHVPNVVVKRLGSVCSVEKSSWDEISIVLSVVMTFLHMI